MEMKKLSPGGRKPLITVLMVLLVLSLLGVIGILTKGSYTRRMERKSLQKTESNIGKDISHEAIEGVAPVPGEQESEGYKGRKSISTFPSGNVLPADKIFSKAIRTADISVEIKKGYFSREYARITTIAESCGGYISNSMAQSTDGRITSGTITIRVPADSYSKVMEEIRSIGKVTSMSESSEDVGEEYVDLESRISNLRAQLSVYLSLLQRAKSVEETLSVQREISAVQEQIEQLTGRKNYLDNRIQFATINITVVEEGAAKVEGWGIKEAFTDAIHGIVDGFNAVVRFTGRVAVFAALIALLLWAMYYFIVAKRRRSKEENIEQPR